jgi:hypothetical protein
VVDELKALLLESERPVLIDGGGPAAAMIKELEEARIPLEKVDGREYSQACGALFDDVANLQVRHIGQPELTAAAMGASKRPLGMRGRGPGSRRRWISARWWGAP